MATSVPPTIAPPSASFWSKLAPWGAAAGCWYVLDCRKAFRAFVRVLTGAVVLEVKKFVAGFELWNARTGVNLKADFEATTKEELSLKG
jgi:hypothetical protein